jgi:hypothetical protein
MNFNINLKNEGSDLITKLMSAQILIALMILSVVYFASAFNEYLNQFVQARQIKLISFGVLFVMSSTTFYFLFRSKTPKVKVVDEPHQTHSSLSFESIAFKLLEGFIDGFRKPQPQLYNKNQLYDKK